MLSPPRHVARVLLSEVLGSSGFTVGSISHSSLSFSSALFSTHFSRKEPEEWRGAGIWCHPGSALPTAPGKCGGGESSQHLTWEITACRLQLGEKTQISECLGWEGASTRVP